MKYADISAVRESVVYFRDSVTQVLNDEIPLPDIKKVTSSMGMYAQREKGTFMQRVRIPAGSCTVEWLSDIVAVGKQYGAERLHFTTRQDIQYHGLGLEQTIEVQEALLKKNLIVTGGGGNQPRNVACSPLSGYIADEEFDVMPYAMAAGNYIIETIGTYHLPRKFKVNFSNNDADTVNASITDLGFIAQNEGGKHTFKVFVAGGMGRNPKAGIVYDEHLPVADILYVIEGTKRLFEKYGNYDNRNRARLRYVREDLGDELFLKTLREMVQSIKNSRTLEAVVHARPVEKKGSKIDLVDERLVVQKQEGLYGVYVHPLGGYVDLEQAEALVSLLEEMEDKEAIDIRLTFEQGIYLFNLNGEEAKKVLERTASLHVAGIADRIEACVGANTCQIGIAPSEQVLTAIHTYFQDKPKELQDLLPSIHISGCQSSCTGHQVAPIGLVGGKKRMDDVPTTIFTVFINGHKGIHGSQVGEEVGIVKVSDVPELLEKLARWSKENNLSLQKPENLKKGMEQFVLKL